MTEHPGATTARVERINALCRQWVAEDPARTMSIVVSRGQDTVFESASTTSPPTS